MAIEPFVIDFAKLFYREIMCDSHFEITRLQIYEYSNKISLLIVDGVKFILDELIDRLNRFFQMVHTQKQRLFSHPLIDNAELLLEVSIFSY